MSYNVTLVNVKRIVDDIGHMQAEIKQNEEDERRMRVVVQTYEADLFDREKQVSDLF